MSVSLLGKMQPLQMIV